MRHVPAAVRCRVEPTGIRHEPCSRSRNESSCPTLASFGSDGLPMMSPRTLAPSVLLLATSLFAQDAAQTTEAKRLFGIVPNYRTSPSLTEYAPLSNRGKFALAAEDGFDRGTFALAALFGGQGQMTNSNRSFGQGGAAYGKYFGTAYGDLLIGDYMTEAVMPSSFTKIRGISVAVSAASGRDWDMPPARSSGRITTRAEHSSTTQRCSGTPPRLRSRTATTPTTGQHVMQFRSSAFKSASIWRATS